MLAGQRDRCSQESGLELAVRQYYSYREVGPG